MYALKPGRSGQARLTDAEFNELSEVDQLDYVYTGIAPRPVEDASCKECGHNVLYPVPGHAQIAECGKCGHPNDI